MKLIMESKPGFIISFPFAQQGELNLEEGEHFHDRPPLDIVIRKFRPAKITAYIAGVFFTALFVCIWPGSMLSIDMLDFSGFNAWTIISRVWAFVAATFIIVVPLVQEVNCIFLILMLILLRNLL